MISKVCCSCKLEKSADNYCKNRSSADSLSAQCRSCSKVYREEHKHIKYDSHSKQYRAQYLKNNNQHINQLRRNNYWSNLDKYRQANRTNHIKHRSKRLSYFKSYYNRNVEYFKAKSKRYRSNNMESILLRNRKRKSKLIGNVSQEQINYLLELFDNKCYYCGEPLSRGVNLHLDHRIPICRNGIHHISNIVPSCSKCNLQKGRKTEEEFVQGIR